MSRPASRRTSTRSSANSRKPSPDEEPSHPGSEVTSQAPVVDPQPSATASNGSDTPLTSLSSSPLQDPGDAYAPTPGAGPSDESSTPVAPRAEAQTVRSPKGVEGEGAPARGSTSKAGVKKRGAASSAADVVAASSTTASADSAGKSKRPRQAPKRAQLPTDDSFFASPAPAPVKITLKVSTTKKAANEDAPDASDNAASSHAEDATGRGRKSRRQSAIEPQDSGPAAVYLAQQELEAPTAGPSQPAIPPEKPKGNKKRKSEVAPREEDGPPAAAPPTRVARKRGTKRVDSPIDTAEGEEQPAQPAHTNPTGETDAPAQADMMDIDEAPAPAGIPEEAAVRPRKRPKRIIASPSKPAADTDEQIATSAQEQSGHVGSTAAAGSIEESAGTPEGSSKTPKIGPAKTSGLQPVKPDTTREASTATTTPKPSPHAGPGRHAQRPLKKPAPPKPAPMTSMLSQTLKQLQADSSKATPVKKDDKAEQKRKRDVWSDAWVLTPEQQKEYDDSAPQRAEAARQRQLWLEKNPVKDHQAAKELQKAAFLHPHMSMIRDIGVKTTGRFAEMVKKLRRGQVAARAN